MEVRLGPPWEEKERPQWSRRGRQHVRVVFFAVIEEIYNGKDWCFFCRMMCWAWFFSANVLVCPSDKIFLGWLCGCKNYYFALITGAASSLESNRNFGREHSRLPLDAREPSQLRLEKKHGPHQNKCILMNQSLLTSQSSISWMLHTLLTNKEQDQIGLERSASKVEP